MNLTSPVPRHQLLPIWVSVGAGVLFLITAIIQGVFRSGYDWSHQAVSALSLGENGWIQQINFIIIGSAMLLSLPAWKRVLEHGYGEKAYPILTGIVGLGFIALAFLPQDPAPGYDPENLSLASPTTMGLVHMSVAGITAICSVAGLLVISRRFKNDPNWAGWTTYTCIMAVAMIMCVIVYGVWSTKASGLAGLFERIALLIPIIWGCTFLKRLSSGTPFMVIQNTAADYYDD